MCGIAGILNVLENKKPVNGAIIEKMLSIMHYRGPDESGIYLSFFFFFRLKIPWSAVIDIGEYRYFQKAYLVRAKEITPFHILYSLNYSRSLRPGFLFKRSIDNGEELVQEIQQRIQLNKRKESL